MNYYEHHIGDYAEATLHLSFVEDAAYSRLIRKYYSTERPIPADVAAAQRLVGARTREERAAVDLVLREFFVLREDGWHQDRCDEEIATYRAGEPEREAKKTNEEIRLARHRAERAELFAVINAAGQHAAWNTPMERLRQIVADLQRDSNGGTATPATQPATATATPATATQTPVPIHQTPDTNTQTPDTSKKLESKSASRAKRKSPLPPDFAISDRVRRWAAEKGHTRLDEHFESFLRKVRARGYVYADWDEALMNAIADDWAKLRAPGSASTTNRQHGETAKQREAREFFDNIGRSKDRGSGSGTTIDSTAERVD